MPIADSFFAGRPHNSSHLPKPVVTTVLPFEVSVRRITSSLNS